MSGNIIRMVDGDIEKPNYGPESAEGAIEGDPIESTHEYYAKDGNTTGVWSCSPGRMFGEQEEDEFVTLLSGKLGLIDEADGQEEIFVAGDSFFLAKGGRLTWVVYEPILKFYMTAE
jgi:uncharacterized cupin superfamily protein